MVTYNIISELLCTQWENRKNAKACEYLHFIICNGHEKLLGNASNIFHFVFMYALYCNVLYYASLFPPDLGLSRLPADSSHAAVVAGIRP